MGLFLPTYFAPILQYTAIVKSTDIIFEIEDNYQKQTYRNRCYIYGPNGKQLLNIPIQHTNKNTRKKTKDILVEETNPWQQQHLKSIQNSYRSSPFFEFYEDDLQLIFTKKYKYLLDVNFDCHAFIMDALQLNDTFSKTSTYTTSPNHDDYRLLSNAKQEHKGDFKKYIQLFDHKHGFIPNLSILDLLFMEGPNAISYLE